MRGRGLGRLDGSHLDPPNVNPHSRPNGRTALRLRQVAMLGGRMREWGGRGGKRRWHRRQPLRFRLQIAEGRAAFSPFRRLMLGGLRSEGAPCQGVGGGRRQRLGKRLGGLTSRRGLAPARRRRLRDRDDRRDQRGGRCPFRLRSLAARLSSRCFGNGCGRRGRGHIATRRLEKRWQARGKLHGRRRACRRRQGSLHQVAEEIAHAPTRSRYFCRRRAVMARISASRQP
jgi:hypothetical protein